jgi:BMFP domain-containing protein YqiC
MSLVEKLKGLIGSTRTELDTIRHRIAELKIEARAIADAPVPLEEAVADLDACLDYMAGHRQLNVGMHTYPSDRLSWPKLDVEELFVTLRPLIRQTRLDAIQRELSTRLPGLPRNEREARLREIDQQLLTLERAEETMIEEAAAGITIARRVDADPRAVLS